MNRRSFFARRIASFFHRATGRGQSGQSLILFAVLLMTLVAGTGLVIDTGYAYQQKRLAQNAADGAALAAAQYLVSNRSQTVSCSTLSALIQQYVSSNLPGASVTGTYIAPGGSTWDTLADTSCLIPPLQPGQNPSVVGVHLTVTHVHPTFFMQVLNLKTMTVSAQATAEYFGSWSIPLNSVLPIILDDQQWSDVTNTSVWDARANWYVTPESPAINSAVRGCPLGYWDPSQGPGQQAVLGFYLDITTPINCGYNATPKIAAFSWGPLNTTCNQSTGQCSNSDSNIKCLMNTSCINSNFPNMSLHVGDYVQISGGVRDVNFFNYLQTYAGGKDMIVPLVSHQDIQTYSCPNCALRVKGFAWIRIVQSYSNGRNSYFTAAWRNPSQTKPIPANDPNLSDGTYNVASWGLVQ